MPTVDIASCFASFASTALYPRDTSCSEVGPAKVVEASKSQKAGLIAGLVAEFVSWRVVYYLAIGLQTVVFAMLYSLVPDYPVRTTGISYLGIMTSMAKFCVTEPLLIQSCLVTMASMACFTNFWVRRHQP